jgi:hypothetical protein
VVASPPGWQSTGRPDPHLQAKALVAAIDRNSAFVGRARDAVSFSPKDLASAHAFLAKEREARKVRREVC